MKIDIKFNSLQNALNESGATLRFRKILKSNSSLDKILKNFNDEGKLENINNSSPHFAGGLMFFNNIFVIGTSGTGKQNNYLHFTNCESFNIADNNLYLTSSEELFKDSGDLKKPFEPCTECLTNTNWNNYINADDWAKRLIIRQFNVLHLFDHIFSLQRELISKIHSSNTIEKLPKNFLRTLESVKAKKNWNCEACKIDTSGLKKIFHILAKNENQFSDNADDYYGLCALCLKKANNYVIIFPEEYDYAEKNKK
jgi:hypothetical protein